MPRRYSNFARVHYLPGSAAYLLHNWLFTLDDHIGVCAKRTTGQARATQWLSLK